MDNIDFSYLLTIVFTAIYGVFGIYHLTSFLILRYKILLYYFILILGLTLHGSLYLFINNPVTNEISQFADKATLITAMITIFGLLMFTKNYLNINKSDHPNLSKIYTIFTAIVVCLPIVHILNNSTIENGWLYDFFERIAATTAMATIFLNLFSGFRLYNTEKINRYYLFSYAPMLFGSMLYTGSWFLKRYYDFDANPIVLTSSILTTLQLILFSIIISFKFKYIEDENSRIQVETNQMLIAEVDKQTKNLQIAKKELENKNVELEILNRLKNKLFALITHDVRGPLVNINAIIELIEDDIVDNELKGITKKLKNQIRDRISMINGLLEWSYQQLEGVTLNNEYCDVEKVFKAIVIEFQQMTEAKEVEIQLNISCPKLFIDENMLKVILRNLTSNAIKFSKKGQKIILSSQRNSG
ncbi:sensor histidine kinase, partial [Maribacter sp.]|nr:sensor histidine kinase [Maribacter sp.]